MGGALGPLPRPFSYRIWSICALSLTLAAVIAFAYFDVPISKRVFGLLGSTKSLEKGFGSVILLTVEASVAFGLVLHRIIRGHLSPVRETTALACLTSIC